MKTQSIIILVIVLALVIVGGWYLLSQPKEPSEPLADPLNTSYMIEGREVVLVDGEAEEEIMPGSASKILTMVMGDPVLADINSDGLDDAIVILAQNTGGTGTFFYTGLALNSEAGYQGTNGVLLGDRISPQAAEFQEGVVIVNYLDRAEDEPMAEEPTVPETKYLMLENNQLKEIAGNAQLYLFSPKPGAEIESPLIVKGKARGTWFFEADFPLVLTDWDGLIIAQSYASSQEDWMTKQFIAFQGTIEFTAPTAENRNGSLILQKDNPSDLPEFDDALELPIVFK